MSLDPNKPTDQALVSELPRYIRALTTEINNVIAGIEDFNVNVLSIPGGTTELVTGVDVLSVAFEIIIASGITSSIIEKIIGAKQGQIKLFIFSNNNLAFLDGSKSIGEFYLNQLPVGSEFVAREDDAIMLVNIGGNGTDNYGYWKEISRQISVK